jgi:tellurite resistance protein
MSTEASSLLERVVTSMGSGGPTPSGRSAKSILSQAASSYARMPDEAESTIPTGFDPQAASLFEAVVEAAFLVANADGVFDDTERQTFEKVVAEACENTVQPGKVHDLVSDLCDQLEEDGFDGRIERVAAGVADDEHRHEVLRIASLMAHISGGVDETERKVLEDLAKSFGMSSGDVDDALKQAGQALGAS